MLRPHSLINSHGKPHFGRFSQPVNDINVQNADYRTPMNKRASALRKHFAYKRFQYFGAMSDSLIFGCALADLRYLGVAFVYVYRLSDGAMRTWQIKSPFARGMDLTKRPDNGVSILERGKRRIRMSYTLNSVDERRKQLEVDFGKDLLISAKMQEPAHYDTMALCTPTAVNGWVYAQKTAALPVTGELRCDLGSFDLSALRCFGHHDFSAGFMRRETFWNWACFSGQQGKQPPLGLNVSWGVNETGWSENCFWVGDQLHTLPAVQFRFDRDNDHSRWRVSSENGQIDLAFTPRDLHRERLNVGVMASNFRQIFGQFNGHLITEQGERFDIENQYGFVEDQYAKW